MTLQPPADLTYLMRWAALPICLAFSGLVHASDNDHQTDIEFFEKRIRPVLVSHCYKCHSKSADEVGGGLLLDSREGSRRGGESGPAIVPGDVDASLIVRAIRHQDLEMPPDKRLPEQVIADIAHWVKMGAPDPRESPLSTNPGPAGDMEEKRDFWSFQPIRDPAIPAVEEGSWPHKSLDYFVLAKLQEHQLRPLSAAGRQTLIRRATFALTGLPPTAEEIANFLEDEAPGALAKVFDRLLASPHYGERWARHWLDVARYAEDQAHSFKPRLYPQGFRYRDWIVNAMNSDMPYDRFIIEQIAADLLEEPGRFERLPALGFFACGPVYYGDKLKFDQLDDRVDTLTRGVLGLTVACARCHDHKYDPISIQDYYSLAGVFASSEYEETPLVPQEVVDGYDEAQAAIKSQQEKLDKFAEEEAKRLKVSRKEIKEKLPPESKKKLDALRNELERRKKSSPPRYAFAHTLKDQAEIHNLKVNIRGNPKTQGPEVPRQFVSVLAGPEAAPFTEGSGRLELARCIASQENPLTARVIVNRIWQHLFGRGLVASTSNFGARGQRPSHPLLLDHLASLLIKKDWSIKSLIREIMLSSTYQLSSSHDERNYEIDPENVFLWQMRRQRLEVEAWRDAMLSVAGNLDATMGGPSVQLDTLDNRRRTLYAKISRHDLDSLLRLFDFPEPNITSASRNVTTVPLQQLFVLNSEFVMNQARQLAAQLTADPHEDDASRIRRAFLLAFGRAANTKEVARGVEFVSGEITPGAGPSKWEQYAQVLLGASEFMFVD